MTGTASSRDRRHRGLHGAHGLVGLRAGGGLGRSTFAADGEAAAELLQVESDREVRTLGRDDEHANRLESLATAAAASGRSRHSALPMALRASSRSSHNVATCPSTSSVNTSDEKLHTCSSFESTSAYGRPRRRMKGAQYTALVPISMKIFADSASAFIAERPDAAPRQLAWDGFRGGRTPDHQ